MTPNTSMLDVGVYIEPNQFIESTSPFVQNSRIDFGITMKNPSSPSYGTEHIIPGGAEKDINPTDFKSYHLKYTVPMSNFVPRFNEGWIGEGTFFNGFSENTRMGVSAAYNVSSGLPHGQNPNSKTGFYAAPYVSTNLLNIGGNEGGSTVLEKLGIGALRFITSSLINTGLGYGYSTLKGKDS